MNASLIKVSIRTIWSVVLVMALKSVRRFEGRLLDSRNHVNLLQVQLVKAKGL